MVYANWYTPDSQHVVLFITQVFFPIAKASLSTAVASTFLTVSTNIVVTSLITFRLLRARRALAKVIPSADMRVYTGVIAILVESAAPLTIFGIVAAMVQQVDTKSIRSPGFYVFDFLFQGLFYSFGVSSNHQLPPQISFFLTFSLKGALPTDDHIPGHDWPLLYPIPQPQGRCPVQPNPVCSPNCRILFPPIDLQSGIRAKP
jgi:hypothetical protein